MSPTSPRAARAALYRAVWRWHFLAGLCVLPFVLLLAITGGIYLFKDEINALTHRDLHQVEVGAAPRLPTEITAAALDAHPGTLKAYSPAAAADRSAQVDIQGVDGTRDTVFVDPYTARVLGTLPDGGASGSPAMQLVRDLHSLTAVGWLGNRLIELAAGWLILLVGSGLYLWLPRGRTAVGTYRIKAHRGGRPWWRDLHAVTGLYASSVILFLALTGMPWSGIWGTQFYDTAYALGLGMPDGYWSALPQSQVPTGDVVDRAPWIMEHQPIPASTPPAGEDGARAQHHGATMAQTTPDSAPPPELDRVVARVEALGLHPGYDVTLPSGPTGVYTASVYPDDITHERVIHLDRYSTDVLYDAGLQDLGTLGRWAEWGVSVHMGQEFGRLNQIVLLLACLAMIALCLSGVAMWWKRRPSGALGVPTVPTDWRMPRALLVMAVLAGLLFPLVGLSLLLLAAIELAVHLRARQRGMA